jgi:hypothetical protein
LNWYASREVRLQGIYEHTDFLGVNRTFAATPYSDFIILRATLIY